METIDIIQKRTSLKGCLSNREIEEDKIMKILDITYPDSIKACVKFAHV